MNPTVSTARGRGNGKESASASSAGGGPGPELVGGCGDRPALEFRSVRKSFPGVTAVDDVSFSLRFGEIHCLVGENGAGKTSLLNIAAGIYRPDAGAVVVEGRSVSIDSPAAARTAGIATVRQHPALVPGNTVAENLLLGRRACSRLDRAAAAAALAAAAARLGIEVDPEARVEDLSPARRQQVEIARALWWDSRILLLDEPTSALAPAEAEELGRMLAALRDEGRAILLVTHHVEEALAWADRISVMRAGRLVTSLTSPARGGDSGTDRSPSRAELLAAMFGERGLEDAPGAAVRAVRTSPAGLEEPVLELTDVWAQAGTGDGLLGVSLAVRPGEVLGVAGVEGSGRHALAEVIAGQLRPHRGDVRMADTSVAEQGVAVRHAAGVSHVSGDRLGEGIVPAVSIAFNLLLKRIGRPPHWRYGFVRRRVVERTALEELGRFDVKAASPWAAAGTLSGGSIQKLMLARELLGSPRVVVFENPTAGLDHKTTIQVRGLIARLVAEEGLAAVVVSTDLDEIVQLADRVVVLAGGRIVSRLTRGPGTYAAAAAAMVGAA